MRQVPVATIVTVWMTLVDATDQSDGLDTQGDHDLADRAALRRVAGLSTELTDITEVEYRQLQLERVVLVGVWTDGTAARTPKPRWPSWPGSPRPPARWCWTRVVQRRGHPDAATYIGSGQGHGAARDRRVDRRRHGDLRR